MRGAGRRGLGTCLAVGGSGSDLAAQRRSCSRGPGLEQSAERCCPSPPVLPALPVQRSGLFSDEFSFHAAPAPGPDQTVHILTLADQGVGEGQLGPAGIGGWEEKNIVEEGSESHRLVAQSAGHPCSLVSCPLHQQKPSSCRSRLAHLPPPMCCPQARWTAAMQPWNTGRRLTWRRTPSPTASPPPPTAAPTRSSCTTVTFREWQAWLPVAPPCRLSPALPPLGSAPLVRRLSGWPHHPVCRYARGYAALWDAWLYQQQELAARVPYMVRRRAAWRAAFWAAWAGLCMQGLAASSVRRCLVPPPFPGRPRCTAALPTPARLPSCPRCAGVPGQPRAGLAGRPRHPLPHHRQRRRVRCAL